MTVTYKDYVDRFIWNAVFTQYKAKMTCSDHEERKTFYSVCEGGLPSQYSFPMMD